MPAPVGGLPMLATLYPAGSLPIVDPQGTQIPNLGDPTHAQDAATKNYIDTRPSVLTAYGTIAAVIATDFTGVPNGTYLAIVTPDDIYEIVTSPSAAIIAATDGITVIQPTTPNTIRIVRHGYAAQYVANWWIDQSAGADTNDGLTNLTPLKTLSEFQRRFCPNGAIRGLPQVTQLNIAAGTYGEGLFVNVFGNAFTIQGSFTSGSNITLATGTVNASAAGSGTRAQVVTLSGTFAVGQRLRCVSGSHVGATCYVQALNGDAQHAFVTPWVVASQTYRATTVSMAVGDVVVADTNTTFLNQIEIISHNVSAVAVFVRNISAIGGLVSSPFFWSVRSSSVFLGVIFDLCQGFFESKGGDAYFMRCQGGWYQTGGLLAFQGGNRLCQNYIWQNCEIHSIGGDAVDTVGLQVYNVKLLYSSDDAGGINTIGIQFEGIGAGSCYQLGTDTFLSVSFGMAIWGVTGAATGVAFNFSGGPAKVLIGQSLVPTVNALKQIALSNGNSYSFAQAPVRDIGARQYFSLNASGDASVPLATRSAAVAATAVYPANPPKGRYRIDGDLLITVIGTNAGSQLALFITSTDDNGTVQKRQATAWLSGTALDYADFSIDVRTNGSSPIQWSVESPSGVAFPSGGGFAYESSLSCERRSP